jgi:gliding motility-associated-like protein
MKRALHLLMILFTVTSFSQAITVNSSTFTVPQLVNSVLINSPCVSGTNITWRTGTNFGSTNGIGYFENTNPNFPMQSGVILSTGNAVNSIGPNNSMLNDGSNTWSGDSDLETTLLASGITMASKNASLLEFDFTPISSSFSFDFIFASEEYGNFQCQFSDAFAFLLTNTSTGVTTNLAVIPGTSTPISVVTIRDFLYNSSCPSVNPSYFGSFNGGSSASGSATNFNGQTVLMSASSVLVPNTQYHIKLVIADRNDSLSDSAIFLSSTSFNIGQNVLGANLTIQDNTAICFGENYTIHTGLNPADYTFTWTKDGVTIAGETGPNLIINQGGIYGVTYVNILNPCNTVTDLLTVEYYPEIIVTTPNDIYKCNTGAANYSYDLTTNTTVVMTGQPASSHVAYFNSLINANNNVNPISSPYTSPGNETIYVRVTNGNNQCFAVKSFQLLISAPPVANQPADLVMCERSMTIHDATFSLISQNTNVLNGQSATINIVSYYTSQANANAGANPIITSSYVGTNGTTIYVRVQNVSDSSCYSVTSFHLVVNPKPLVDTLLDVVVCTDYILPPLTNGNYFTGNNGTGTPLFAGNDITVTQTIYIFNQPYGANTCFSQTSFRVKIIDLNTLDPGNQVKCDSFTLPSPDYASFYTQPGGMGTLLHEGDVITTSQTVYMYYVSLLPPFCVAEDTFVVTIIPSPVVPDYPNVFSCVSYTLPTLTVGKYFTGTLGSGSEILAGTVITSTQTLYVYAETGGTPNCIAQDEFTIFIGLDPVANVTECVSYTLPNLPIGNYFTGVNGTGTQLAGGTVITTTQGLHVYAVSSSGCSNDVPFTVTISLPYLGSVSNQVSCGGYILPVLSVGNYYTASNGTGTMLLAGRLITTSQTIFIYVNNGAGCQNEIPLNITINQLPQIDSRSSIDVCDNYILTSLTVGNYYTGSNGTGTMLAAGTAITSTQTIYIYAISSSTPPCVAENNFTISIFNRLADAPANVTICDSYTLPALTHGNYYTQTGGFGTMLHAGNVITTTQTLFVFVDPPTRGVNCLDENSFTITINHTPIIANISNVNACRSYVLPASSVGNYFTQTGGTGTMLNAGDVITSNQTVFVYAQTATTPNCSDEKSFTISLFKVDTLPNVTTCSSYQLPALTIGQYYTGSNGTGTMLFSGNNVSSTRTIYIFSHSPYSSCSDETSFVVTIIPQPIANAVPLVNRTICDTDGNNEGYMTFDLTTLNSIILGTQTSSEFSLAYYESLSDANTATNPITSTMIQSVFVRVNNSLAPNCFDVKNIIIIVNKLPEPTPQNGVICIDNVTGNINNPYTIMSGLSSSTHTFTWTNPAGLVVGLGSSLTVSVAGNYSVVATSNLTGCSSEPTVASVTVSQPAIITYATSDDFSENQNITVTATGSGGDYEYQLDNGPFQDSNIFEDAPFGNHTITVRDKNGCGVTTIDALLVNYPKFFTPNGDGFNDNWNVIGLKDQPDAKISIYDRYGKFLKQFSPRDQGWDGVYNGQVVPATDYWFSVTYAESGSEKEFKAHFSLKR